MCKCYLYVFTKKHYGEKKKHKKEHTISSQILRHVSLQQTGLY